MKLLTTWAYVFAYMGLIFSGYLSAVKFFTNTCAFNESCPYFLGYPACWYGFALYFLTLIVLLCGSARKITRPTMFEATAVISFVGIIFSGSFVVQEFSHPVTTGILGLSTCVYGFIFYILLCGISVIGHWKSRSQLLQ
jgi:hypothetical protein